MNKEEWCNFIKWFPCKCCFLCFIWCICGCSLECLYCDCCYKITPNNKNDKSEETISS